jgi:CheY-like chemotaxis protein
MLESVFDLFAQIEGTDDRSQGGLGIGLTLVKRLVEMHDGTIEVRSEGRGLGSEFVVRLPLAAGAQTFAEGEEDPSPIELPVEIVPRSTVRKRILIVDDNVDAAEGLSRLLGLEHHEVLVAHDGLEALAANERMHPDVVLLDIGLPRLDGLEVARRIRKASEGSPPLLVATTGFDQAKDRHRIAEAGFDHHLIKPLDPGVLRSLVQAARAR